MRTAWMALLAAAVSAGAVRGQEGGPAALSPAASLNPYLVLYHEISTGGQRLAHGIFPRAYRVLLLTEDQEKAIEGLCSKAKEEARAGITRPTERSAEAYRSYYAEMGRKREEVVAKYSGLIEKVLTEEQLKTLNAIRAAGVRKTEQDEKARAAYMAAMEKTQKEFESECANLLNDAQKKKLDEVAAPARGRPGNLPSARFPNRPEAIEHPAPPVRHQE